LSFAMAAVAAVGLLIGIAVGCTGIGGVLMIPILTLVLGIDGKHAIAAALLSYLPRGFVAVTLYARRGSVPWREARLLCLVTLPAAYLGARRRHRAGDASRGADRPVVARWRSLRAAGRAPCRRDATAAGGTLGGGTGFISALTGAGGAFVLLPILLLLDVPVLSAIGVGQGIAIPIAGTPTIRATT